jgi:8-hydroxy-5-deazaflavin:NADPH oxidoreductase
MQIGIIGAGHIGGTLARLWVQAGHDVMLSARDLARVERLAVGLGPRALAGQPLDAARFGAVVLLAVPFGGVPALEIADAVAGKTSSTRATPTPSATGRWWTPSAGSAWARVATRRSCFPRPM